MAACQSLLCYNFVLQDNKLSYSEFCVMMHRRRTSEKKVGAAEERRKDAQSDNSKKYQVD